MVLPNSAPHCGKSNVIQECLSKLLLHSSFLAITCRSRIHIVALGATFPMLSDSHSYKGFYFKFVSVHEGIVYFLYYLSITPFCRN